MTSDRVTWSLFADWCTAADVGLDELDAAAVDEFLGSCTGADSTRRRRASTLRTGLERVGLDALPARPPLPLPTRPDTERVLPELPRYSWPTAVGARRDACVAVLAGLGLTRAQMRAVTVGDIAATDQAVVVSAAGRDLPVARGDDPDSCPACAISRWVRALGVLHRRGESGLAERIHQPPAETRHDCLRALAGDVDQATPLVVAVDRHGHVAAASAMTPRAISALLSRTTRAGFRTEPTRTHGAHGPWLPHDVAMARLLDEVARLDAVDLESDRLARAIDKLASGA